MNRVPKKTIFLLLALLVALFWTEAQAGKPVKITVTEAIPAEGIQGQALGVRIKGTGFDHGSQVRFLVSGTRDDSQIDVGAVSFDAATGDLVADIQVKDQALVVEYDVEVKTSSGRRGKGTTLFRVRYRAEEDPCVSNTSYFPAFAYVEARTAYGNSDFDFHLASADAICDVVIYSGPVSPSSATFSYRYYDHGDGTGTGKIAWAKHRDTEDAGSLPVVRMLEFHVAGRRVTDVLPVASELLLQGNFRVPDLAPEGNRLVYYGREDSVKHYLAELELANCAISPCTSRFLEVTDTGNSVHAYNPRYSLSWPRVYFTTSQDTDGMYAFGYVEKLGDSWSEPLFVKVPECVWHLDVGLWDWDEDAEIEEVLVVSTGHFFIEVWGCLDPGETPCPILTDIPGKYATIKSIDGNPSLIYRHSYTKHKRRSDPAIFEYDLYSGEIRMLVDAPGGQSTVLSAVDAAD